MKPVVPGSDATPVIHMHSRQNEKKDFLNTFKIAEVNTLLRTSPHYGRWKDICQNNATSAEKLAELILERNELQEKAENGKAIDWTHFDWLTEQIQYNGISMLKSKELINQGIVASPPPAKKLAEPISPPPLSSIVPTLAHEKSRETDIIPFPGEGASSERIELTEENFLIFDMRYQGNILNQGIVGYGNQEKVLLALNDITRSLDFNIDVDPKNGRAWGWLISDDHPFKLDIPNSELLIDGKKHGFSDHQVTMGKNDIYVDSQALAEWFPVDFNIAFSDLTININPREKLLFQEKMDRQRKRDILDRQVSFIPELPFAASEYRLAAMPFVDVHLDSSYTNDDMAPDHQSRYSILSKGDLLKMTSTVFMSGHNEDHLNNLRLTMEKSDPEDGLLNGFKASRYAFGDIDPSYFPIHNTYPMERGVIVEKGDMARSAFFDKTLFQGNLQPGWEVEVYRNDRLIASMVVGENGRYRFDDVLVYYGDNDFKLVFYGPQGQRQEETKRITIGDDMIRKGKDAYQFSVTQQNTPMFDVDEEDTGVADDSARVTANFERGLRDNLAFNTGVASFEINGDRHGYVNAGLKGTAGGIAARTDLVHDITGGDALQTLIQTGFGPIRIRSEHDIYRDFVDEKTADSLDPLESVTNIRARGFVPEPVLLSGIQYGLTFDHTDREHSYNTVYGADLYLAQSIGKFYISNDLDVRQTDSNTSSHLNVDGFFRVAGNAGPNFFRGQLNYDIEPEAGFTSFDLKNRWYINPDLNLNLQYLQHLQGHKKREGSLSLSWDAGKFLLTPRLSYDSDGVFKAFVGLDFSLGQEPRTRRFEMSSDPIADSGAVSAFAFHDRNANHIFDDGDAPIKNAEIDAVQFGKNAKTNDQGVAFITGLPKFNATDIKIRTDTLEDPFWQPVLDGNSIKPPPGNVHQIDFPVIATGEVDGTLYGLTPEGEKAPLKNVRIHLLDDSGSVVQTIKSEYDGFYLFMKVPPGTYTVRVAPDDLNGRTARFNAGRTVTIGPDGNVVSGMNIVLGGQAYDEKSASAQMHQEAPNAHAHIPVSQPPDKKSITLYDENGWLGAPKEITPARQKAPVAFSESTSGFGVHLTSYRTQEKAVAGIDWIKKKYKNLLSQTDFTVRQVDLGPEKGVWYRVIAGPFDHKGDADLLCSKLKRLQPYTRVLSIRNKNIGLHLTSYRTNEKAAAGIRWLQGRLEGVFDESDFCIKRVDLGPEKGIWYRVIAGSFESRKAADMLCEQIKPTQSWCKGYPVENRFRFGIHMASFRTNDRASKGIQVLTKQYRQLLGESEFIVRRVDLGPEKGIWYRVIVGSFDTRQDAERLAMKLKQTEPYCRTCELDTI